MELVDRKTASLFSACARLGAIAAGADEAQESKLGEYAWNLGMAFQLVDDMLDFTSRKRCWASRRATICAKARSRCRWCTRWRRATPEERQVVETVIGDGNYEQVPFMRVLQILEHHKTISRAYDRAHAFTRKARELIRSFPESPAQRALQAVVELVTERAA